MDTSLLSIGIGKDRRKDEDFDYSLGFDVKKLKDILDGSDYSSVVKTMPFILYAAGFAVGFLLITLIISFFNCCCCGCCCCRDCCDCNKFTKCIISIITLALMGVAFFLLITSSVKIKTSADDFGNASCALSQLPSTLVNGNT